MKNMKKAMRIHKTKNKVERKIKIIKNTFYNGSNIIKEKEFKKGKLRKRKVRCGCWMCKFQNEERKKMKNQMKCSSGFFNI